MEDFFGGTSVFDGQPPWFLSSIGKRVRCSYLSWSCPVHFIVWPSVSSQRWRWTAVNHSIFLHPLLSWQVVHAHGSHLTSALCGGLLLLRLDMFSFSCQILWKFDHPTCCQNIWVTKPGIILLTALKIVFVYEIGIALGCRVSGANARERGTLSKFLTSRDAFPKL